MNFESVEKWTAAVEAEKLAVKMRRNDPPSCYYCIYREPGRTLSFDGCKHPSVTLGDPSTGEFEWTKVARWSGRACGPSGRLFDDGKPKPVIPPRPSLWMRILWRLWRFARS